jgi:hypothetical protein
MRQAALTLLIVVTAVACNCCLANASFIGGIDIKSPTLQSARRAFRPALLALVRRQPRTAIVAASSPHVVPRSGPAAPAPDVMPCSPGLHCYPGPGFRSYPDYGDIGPNGSADCTFAAAADWEQIVLGFAPDPSTIEDEFVAAGGTDEGLAQDALWTYWTEIGIGGATLSSITPVLLDRDDVEAAVRGSGAIIAQLQLLGSPLGQFAPTPGLHDLVVDGFTPIGPLVVSWGRTEQLTWNHWEEQAVGAWTVVAAGTG